MEEGMDDIQWFSPRFIGMRVTFAEGRPGTWLLANKISDRSSQATESDFKIYGAQSTAYSTFVCENVNNTNETAFMRIFMQIPHAGSVYLTPQERAEQAEEELEYFARTELEGYKQLRKKRCKCMPALFSYKIEKQSVDGLVPGGYLVFMLLEQVPGIRLDNVYWDLPASERQKIRQAFRVAWQDCLKAGVYLTDTGLDKLVWDGEHDKLYITGIRECEPALPEHHWTDVWWLVWRLAEAPKDYRYSEEIAVHPDTSNWKM